MNIPADSIGKILGHQAGEYLESFVIVGFVAGDGRPIIIQNTAEQKDVLALNALLGSAIRPASPQPVEVPSKEDL